MTLLQRIITGQSDGTTATTANTGATQVTASGGSALTWRDSVGALGETGLRFDGISAAACITRFALNASNATAQFRGRVKLPASLPATALELMTFRYASGRAFSFRISPSGVMSLADSLTTYFPMVATVAVGTQYDISIQATGNSTTAGSATVKVYDTAGVQVGSTLVVTTANFTANVFSHIDLGSSAFAVTSSYGWVDVQFNDGAGSEIAAYTSTVPLATPVLTGTGKSDPTTPGGSDGTVTRSWSAVSGAASYDAYIAPNSTPAQGDFTLVATGVTSPYTWTGLSAGIRTVGIKAKP